MRKRPHVHAPIKSKRRENPIDVPGPYHGATRVADVCRCGAQRTLIFSGGHYVTSSGWRKEGEASNA